MRILILNNALKEENVWFRATLEQARQCFPNLKKTEEVYAIVISGGFIDFRNTKKGLEDLLTIPNVKLEQIKIIDEVPFKTQKEVWEFLVSNEGNVVEHFCGGRKLTLVNGALFDITDQNKCPLALREPSSWKPSSELYKPKAKEWWELNGNKPTLCWYGDDLSRIEAKTACIGLCTRGGDKFCTHNSQFYWSYAVPLTNKDIQDYFFKPLEN